MTQFLNVAVGGNFKFANFLLRVQTGFEFLTRTRESQISAGPCGAASEILTVLYLRE
jgi:hypothetical protein